MAKSKNLKEDAPSSCFEDWGFSPPRERQHAERARALLGYYGSSIDTQILAAAGAGEAPFEGAVEDYWSLAIKDPKSFAKALRNRLPFSGSEGSARLQGEERQLDAAAWRKLALRDREGFGTALRRELWPHTVRAHGTPDIECHALWTLGVDDPERFALSLVKWHRSEEPRLPKCLRLAKQVARIHYVEPVPKEVALQLSKQVEEEGIAVAVQSWHPHAGVFEYPVGSERRIGLNGQLPEKFRLLGVSLVPYGDPLVFFADALAEYADWISKTQFMGICDAKAVHDRLKRICLEKHVTACWDGVFLMQDRLSEWRGTRLREIDAHGKALAQSQSSAIPRGTASAETALSEVKGDLPKIGGEEEIAATVTERPPKAFCKEGNTWRVTFGGKSTPGITDIDGMYYIARLLQTPHIPVDVLDLWVLAHPADLEQFAALRNADQLDMPVPTTNRESRRRIERQIRDFNGDIDAAEQEPGNPEKKAIADEARLGLAKLGKQTKESRTHQNTRRKSTLDCVKKAIDLARTQIAEFNKPLADHLSSPTITTGYNCVYHPPDPAPQWVVILP